jgi:hypothetical protein
MPRCEPCSVGDHANCWHEIPDDLDIYVACTCGCQDEPVSDGD